VTPGEEARAAAGVRRVGKNALSLLGAYMLPRVFTVSAVVVAARVLGTERFGAYGAAAAFAVILSILATLGMHPLLVRDIARAPGAAPRLMRAAHEVKTVASLLMLALLYVLARWGVGLEGEAMVAALMLGLGYAVAAYSENLSAYYQAVERMHVWTQASALLGLVTGGLGALLVLTTRSVAWFSTAALAGQLAALGWLLARAPADVRRGAPARREEIGGLVRALAPFAVAFVALTLHYKLDVLLLERWRTEADVGLYTAAYKFVDIFHALVIVAVGALFPWLARSAPRPVSEIGADVARTGWAGGRTADLALLCSVPVAGALHLAAVPAVSVAFGAQYAASAPAVALLALALPALTLNLLGGYLLGAAHRMGWVAGLYLSSLALKTALDAVLIPRMGAVGAATAMAAAETTLAVLMLFALKLLAHAAPGRRALVAAAGAGALLALAGRLADQGGSIEIAALYLLAVLALYTAAGVVRPRERRVLRRALQGGVATAP
jgi:O-antigen/teichoic acid export membrane protein